MMPQEVSTALDSGRDCEFGETRLLWIELISPAADAQSA